jgi:hypothetical protein
MIKIFTQSLTGMIVFFILQTRISALPLSDIWDYLDQTKFLVLGDVEKESGFFSSPPKPKAMTQEAIAYKLHRFCHSYFRANYKNFHQTIYRPGIESLIWNYYFPQVPNLQNRSPQFFCLSHQDYSKEHLIVQLSLNVEKGFLPSLWRREIAKNILEIQESEAKNGKADSFTFYKDYKNNCIDFKRKDTNGTGNPDFWYQYENCKLTKTEEDYDENGTIERTCYYEPTGDLSYCEGIGEKNKKLAAQALENKNLTLYRKYLKDEIQEYVQEFGEHPRQVCENHLKLLLLEYESSQYEKLLSEYQMISNNPHCRKEELDAQFYTGYTNLYIFSNYKDAAVQYERANRAYKEKFGWDSIDMNLSLSLAYLQLKDPNSCLRSLKKIQGRPFNQKGNFFYYYYYGSCQLENSNLELAISALERAKTNAMTSQDLGLVYLKLGISYWESENKKLSEIYFQKAIQIKSEYRPFILSYKTKKLAISK